MNDAKEMAGIFEGLKDFSFTRMITPKLIKALYILAMVLSVIVGLGIILSGFKAGVLSGIGSLIVSPLVVLLYIISARVSLELIMVIFRIERNTARLVDPQAQTDADAEPQP